MRRVLTVLFPGCAIGEITPALALLAGRVTVTALGPSRRAVPTGEGLSLAVDATFADAPDDAALVLVPGGDLSSVLYDRALGALLARTEAPIAAICNGVLLVGLAGRCDGRRVTHTAVARYARARPSMVPLLELAAQALARSTYLDEDVVIDGPLITAKPWAAIDFAKRAAAHAGLLASAEAASRARYQRGVRDDGALDPYQRWAIFLTRSARATTRDDVLAHVEHLRVLERTGRLELAGPFDGEAGGLVVVRAADRAAAEAIAAADPFVSRGVRHAEVRRWALSCDDSGHLLDP